MPTGIKGFQKGHPQFNTGRTHFKRGQTRNRICTISGCNLKHEALGYCRKHYRRFCNNGNPLVVLPTGFQKGHKNYCLGIGKTPLLIKLRHSEEYYAWRRDIFIRDRFTCQECGKTETYIEAHHIKPFSKFPEFRFDRNNGLTLCEDCHKRTDNYGCKAQKGVNKCP